MTTGSGTLKRRAKRAIDQIAMVSGCLHLLEKRMRGRLCVLMYHRVLSQARAAEYHQPALAMPAVWFEEQLNWLGNHCEVVPLGEAIDRLESGESGGPPLASVTFDDGYVDNHDIAAPALESRGMRGTFFVSTDFIEGRALWYDRLASLLRRANGDARSTSWQSVGSAHSLDLPMPGSVSDWLESAKRMAPLARQDLIRALESSAGSEVTVSDDRGMTPAELRALADAGHEVASHTVSHPILTQLDDDRLSVELAEPREKIRSWTGQPVTSIAYPNGDSDERVRTAALREGYRLGVTTRSGSYQRNGDRLSIPRRDMTMGRVTDHRGTFDELTFRAEIVALHEFIR